MPSATLLPQVGDKNIDKETIAEQVIKNPKLLPEILEDQQAKPARIKYGCAKVIRIISERKPKMLYPYTGEFISKLDAENNIEKWQAIAVIGNLAVVDSKDRIDKILTRFLTPIQGPELITAANTIAAAAVMALAKPKLTTKIVNQILKVENSEYQNRECNNIAIGHTIVALDKIFNGISRKKQVIEFVEQQLENPRAATRKKAEKFLRKYGKVKAGR